MLDDHNKISYSISHFRHWPPGIHVQHSGTLYHNESHSYVMWNGYDKQSCKFRYGKPRTTRVAASSIYYSMPFTTISCSCLYLFRSSTFQLPIHPVFIQWEGDKAQYKVWKLRQIGSNIVLSSSTAENCYIDYNTTVPPAKRIIYSFSNFYYFLAYVLSYLKVCWRCRLTGDLEGERREGFVW